MQVRKLVLLFIMLLNCKKVCGRIDLTKVKSIQLNSPDGELNVLKRAKLLRS